MQAYILQEMADLGNEVTSLKTLMQETTDSLKNDMEFKITSLSNDLTCRLEIVKMEKAILVQENQNIRSELYSLCTQHNNIQNGVEHLQVQQYHQILDQEKLLLAVRTAASIVKQMDDLWKLEHSTIAALDTRLNKANVRVAFTAVRHNKLTVTQPHTIVCDRVITNVGDGYNGVTGIFTAPVSGTYCFMATSGPNGDGVTKLVILHKVDGEKAIAAVGTRDRGRDTGHGTVDMQAGQTVKLKSRHEKYTELTFDDVFFTGMLLQPRL